TASARIVLAGLTVQNGNARSGGGINNNAILTVNRCIIAHNTATGQGWFVDGLGGGILNSGSITLNNSVVAGNEAYNSGGNAFGGGIYNVQSLAINNSTISLNVVLIAHLTFGIARGGGVFGSATINSSTLAENSVVSNYLSQGGAVYGEATFQNSILQ